MRYVNNTNSIPPLTFPPPPILYLLISEHAEMPQIFRPMTTMSEEVNEGNTFVRFPSSVCTVPGSSTFTT